MDVVYGIYVTLRGNTKKWFCSELNAETFCLNCLKCGIKDAFY